MAPNFCPNCGKAVDDPEHTECGECGQDFDAGDEDFEDSSEETDDFTPLAPSAAGDSTHELSNSEMGVAPSKKSLGGLVATTITALFYLYWIGVMLAVPYFNWNYARTNGFVSWLFLGEIVPTVKATIWPYYTYQRLTYKPPPQLKDEVPEFAQSINRYTDATRILHAVPVGQKISPADAKRFLDALNDAHDIAMRADIAKLNKFYPHLGDHFQDEYLAGLNCYVKDDLDTADQYIGNFFLWLGDNSEKLRKAEGDEN